MLVARSARISCPTTAPRRATSSASIRRASCVAELWRRRPRAYRTSVDGDAAPASWYAIAASIRVTGGALIQRLIEIETYRTSPCFRPAGGAGGGAGGPPHLFASSPNRRHVANRGLLERSSGSLPIFEAHAADRSYRFGATRSRSDRHDLLASCTSITSPATAPDQLPLPPPDPAMRTSRLDPGPDERPVAAN